MSRRPLLTGCCVFGAETAYLGSFVAPRPSVDCSGVLGLATYRPIWEYVRPDVAPNVWIRMYFAKHRASEPVSTSLLATEQVGVSIGDAVMLEPAAFSCENSFDCACFAAVTSTAIAVGVMSGVPVICSCLRESLTVERPFMPITIAAMPKAIRTAPATTPPISKNFLIVLSFRRGRFLCACDL